MMYDSIAHYYDLTHADLTADLTLIHSLAKEAGGPLLELGCGSGRLLIPMARAGYQITGIDNSTAMLARAGQRLAGEPEAVQERVTFIEMDMVELTLPGQDGRYPLIILPYNTFLHLDSPQKRVVLNNLRRYLREDGRLFIDLINPLFIANTPNDHFLTLENSFSDPDSDEMVLQFASNQLEKKSQTLHITWIFDATPQSGGSINRTVSRMAYHYLFAHQIELLLAEKGYRLETMAGDYDQSPYHEESDRLIVIAKAQN